MKEKKHAKRSLGEVIKSLRLERNLSQSQFAKIFNIATSTVGMWENDKRSPNEETKEAIAEYFNVDMNYLYGLTLVKNSFKGNYCSPNKLIYDKNKNDIISNNTYKWNAEIGQQLFTKEELDELINYTKFILSKRKNLTKK